WFVCAGAGAGRGGRNHRRWTNWSLDAGSERGGLGPGGGANATGHRVEGTAHAGCTGDGGVAILRGSPGGSYGGYLRAADFRRGRRQIIFEKAQKKKAPEALCQGRRR